MVAVYLSYIAENGLPFVPTYNINVDVAERRRAGQERRRPDRRRAGGAGADDHARAGHQAVAASRTRGSGWRCRQSLEPLPPDTRYQVRLASVLGGKYLEIIPGHRDGPGPARRRHVHAQHEPAPEPQHPVRRPRHGVRHVRPQDPAPACAASLAEFGDAVAGRGTQFNDAIYSLRELIGPLESLLRAAGRPEHPAVAVRQRAGGDDRRAGPGGADDQRPAARTRATTFAGADQPGARPARSTSCPPTETRGTTVLTNAQPVLADAAAIVAGAEAGRGAAAAGARSGSTRIVTAATPVFRTRAAAGAASRRALVAPSTRWRATPPRRRRSRCSAPTTWPRFGASAFVGLGAILRTVAPAQFACNVAGAVGAQLRLGAQRGRQHGARGCASRRSSTFRADVPGSDTRRRPAPQPLPDRGLERSARPATRSTRGQQLIGDPGADVRPWSTTPRRRRGCWRAGRRRGWCREPRRRISAAGVGRRAPRAGCIRS